MRPISSPINRTRLSIPLYLFLFLALMLLSACGAAAPSQTTSSRDLISKEGEYSMGAVVPAAAPMEESAFDSLASNQAQPAKRLVIQNASLTIIVDNPATSLETISAMAVEMNGFVVSSRIDQTTLESGIEVPEGSITIRIPAERLNEALERIEAETDRPVENRTVDSQDVTAEYTDLQSRLRNLERAETQLAGIMENATRTEDVLSVYNELTRVRGEIEVIKGQIQYYEQSAALSAISVRLLANAAVQPLTIGAWQPAGVAKTAVQALLDAMRFLANAAIWIVIFFLPVLLVIFLLFILPVRYLLQALRRRRAAAPTPPAAPPGQPV